LFRANGREIGDQRQQRLDRADDCPHAQPRANLAIPTKIAIMENVPGFSCITSRGPCAISPIWSFALEYNSDAFD
jgi:hypothetical protein